MRIGELAKKSGVSKHTIRFYERLGLLSSTPVEAGSRHYGDYSERSIEAIGRIRRFQELGFSLNEIKKHVRNSEFQTSFSNEELESVLKPKLKELKDKRDSLNKLIDFLEKKLSGEIQR